ncbi:MAG: hypothetical protein IPI32_05725 [Austwickia sp.]|nr:hypothetical protein [Austwickia sp.]
MLDADLKAAFDNISHDLLTMLDGFPAQGRRRMVEAEVMEDGEYLPTEAGTPQGASSRRCC